MSTLKTTNLQNASAASPAIVLAADGTATAQLSSINGGPLAGARNRIINGDMRIDQRNAGVALSTSIGYPVDRFLISSIAANFTYQRSTVAPAGFTNSCLITASSSASPAAGDYRQFIQAIEGFNVADFNLGTASAITFTLSFWVRSSVTGTYSGGVNNNAGNRSYVFTYQINAANTWEYKTITIAGDTTGTWLTDNSKGLELRLDLGSGSTFTASAGSWQSGLFFKSTGSASLSATNGATFYITGVQLEAGSVASPFERRSYGQEVQLCQRYFQQLGGGMVGFEEGNTTHSYGVRFNQPMRAAPTFSLISSSFAYRYINASSIGDRTITVSINGATTISTQGAWLYFNDVGTGSVQGRGAIERNGSNYINASAEL